MEPLDAPCRLRRAFRLSLSHIPWIIARGMTSRSNTKATLVRFFALFKVLLNERSKPGRRISPPTRMPKVMYETADGTASLQSEMGLLHDPDKFFNILVSIWALTCSSALAESYESRSIPFGPCGRSRVSTTGYHTVCKILN